jgi:mRNA interferase MazF
MERVKQYEIWWAELPKPAGRRPVLLLSRDDAYGVLNKFLSAEITTTIRNIPIEVPLGRAEGMAKPCVVNCDNMHTVSKVHLTQKISRIPSNAASDRIILSLCQLAPPFGSADSQPLTFGWLPAP